MDRHPFDALSAALGVLALIAGLFVVLGASVDLDGGGPWWLAVAAALVGLAIIPWRGRRTHDVGSTVLAEDP